MDDKKGLLPFVFNHQSRSVGILEIETKVDPFNLEIQEIVRADQPRANRHEPSLAAHAFFCTGFTEGDSVAEFV